LIDPVVLRHRHQGEADTPETRAGGESLPSAFGSDDLTAGAVHFDVAGIVADQHGHLVTDAAGFLIDFRFDRLAVGVLLGNADGLGQGGLGARQPHRIDLVDAKQVGKDALLFRFGRLAGGRVDVVRHDLIAAHHLDFVLGLAVLALEIRIDGAGLPALGLFRRLDRLGQRGLGLMERLVIVPVGGDGGSRQQSDTEHGGGEPESGVHVILFALWVGGFSPRYPYST
jgi:hypothetical protein